MVTCNDYQREVAVTPTIAGKQIDRVFTFDKVWMGFSRGVKALVARRNLVPRVSSNWCVRI